MLAVFLPISLYAGNAEAVTSTVNTSEAVTLTADTAKAVTLTVNTGNSSSKTIDARINTANPVFISADELNYVNDSSEIYGKGHVVLRNDDVSIFSDTIYVNAEKGEIIAEGNVLAIQKDSSIYTDKLYYNTKDNGAYAKNVKVLSPPWIVEGAELKKSGKKSEIQNPLFTTCDMEKPHYRLQASSIFLYEDEKVECWNAIVYLGNIPVLYLPYFSQPVKGREKPFDFKFGHNDTLGWYGDFSYLIVLDFYNRWTLGFDYMEKIGPKYSLNIDYGFNRFSTGNINGFYTEEKTTHLRHWGGNFTYNQAINDATRLNLRATTLSDSDVGRKLLVPEDTDLFRHDYWAAFSTAVGNHSFSISAADAEQLNTVTSRYETSARSLPSFTYAMMSSQILPRISYGHNLSFNRSYSPTGKYYSDVGSFAPNLQASLFSSSLFSFSASGGMTSAWTNNDERVKGFIGGDLLNSLTAGSTASLDVLPMSMLKLTGNYNYAKQLNNLRGVAFDGVSLNSMRMAATGGAAGVNFDANTTYNFLTDTSKPDGIKGRFSMVNLRVYTSVSDMYFSTTGLYSIYSNMIKNLSFDYNVSDMGTAKLWNLYARTNFVNNLLDANGWPVDPVSRIPDVITLDTGISFNFTDEFKVTIAKQYDLMLKKLTYQTYTVTWFLHCWEANISYSIKPVTGDDGVVRDVGDLFFSIFISALPEAKFNKPTTVSPGYDYNNLLNQYQ